MEDNADLFQAMLDAAPDAMIGVDGHGEIVMANAQAEVIFGYPRQELLGRAVEILVPEGAQGAHPAHRDAFFAEPRTRPMGMGLELAARRADGSEFPAEISLSCLQTDEGPLALAAIRDMTDRRRVQEEVVRARVEADRANQAKSQFLSRISHELRTPLNAVLGFAQLLEIEDDDPRRREMVEQILRGGRHLLGLINEIMDVSRIEAGELGLSLEPVDLTSLITETVRLTDPLASQREVGLAVLPSEGPQWVFADAQRLAQVMLNLLANAVKYNRKGGTVSVSIVDADQSARVRVVDTGRGISADRLTEVFDPFERAGAETTGEEGTGLGLALARGLVEAMGGRMGIESEVDSGTEAWFELPIAARPALTPEEELDGSTLPKVQGAQARVLYVEDNLANLTLLERIFDSHPGYKLTAVMQGRLGLQLAHTTPPALVLLDLHLPDISGEEVLLALRADPEMEDIPVIMISADASKTTRRRLLSAGADGYITKPLDIKELFATIEAVTR